MKTWIIFKDADGTRLNEVLEDKSVRDLFGGELEVGAKHQVSFGEELPPDQAFVEFMIERFGPEEHPEHGEVYAVHLVRPPLN